jgi:hypothetical protein
MAKNARNFVLSEVIWQAAQICIVFLALPATWFAVEALDQKNGDKARWTYGASAAGCVVVGVVLFLWLNDKSKRLQR